MRKTREYGYVAGIWPETEWATAPERIVWSTRLAAHRYLCSDERWVTEDALGNSPEPWIVKVERRDDGTWAPPGCTCDFSLKCPTCILARWEGTYMSRPYGTRPRLLRRVRRD